MTINLDPIYVDHSTGEIFMTRNDAMAAYRDGAVIDLYRNRNGKLEFAVSWVH